MLKFIIINKTYFLPLVVEAMTISEAGYHLLHTMLIAVD
jgi:hypothetical protein